MLIADLKGKLTRSELIGEDFLTSSVFSTFRYLDEHWIEKFINQAINIENEMLNIKLENPSYKFWSWYRNEQKFGGPAEPDVVIFSEETALIFEAKYRSGKSGEGTTETDKGKKMNDQLGKEYFVGLEKILNDKHIQHEKLCSVKHFYLIFLTNHSFLPKKEINETIASIKEISPDEEENAKNRIYWLNWQKAVPLLKEIMNGCLFSWNDVPGNDNERLLKFLRDNLKLGWVENAKIKKSEDGKNITVTKGKNSLWFKLNKKENKVKLEIGGGDTYKYLLKKDDGKLNICMDGKRENSFEYKISEELIEFLERRNITVFSGFKFLDEYREYLNKFEHINKSDTIFYHKIS